MSKQKETLLQSRIQKVIEFFGGYCKKNWGNMTSEPGVADITLCYEGLYICIEVKVDNNTPSKQQGIHARNVWKAGGICIVAWDTEVVRKLFNYIDNKLDSNTELMYLHKDIKEFLKANNIDDGTKW